jgi:hypothetical protein
VNALAAMRKISNASPELRRSPDVPAKKAKKLLAGSPALGL